MKDAKDTWERLITLGGAASNLNLLRMLVIIGQLPVCRTTVTNIVDIDLPEFASPRAFSLSAIQFWLPAIALAGVLIPLAAPKNCG
jgi:hypothetical protein